VNLGKLSEVYAFQHLATFFFYAFTVFLFMKRGSTTVKRLGFLAWTFTFLGLITGMYWAQIAWGSFWSWDPKETLTLVMFGFVTVSIISFLEEKHGLVKLLSSISCVTIIITLLSSFLIQGLHSFLA
jgi:ABC-type transport system involved in cytochrome c biogenesis permease subunit